MSEYNALLDLLAAHSGASRKELRKLARDDPAVAPDAVDECLYDALEANGSFWSLWTG